MSINTAMAWVIVAALAHIGFDLWQTWPPPGIELSGGPR